MTECLNTSQRTSFLFIAILWLHFAVCVLLRYVIILEYPEMSYIHHRISWLSDESSLSMALAVWVSFCIVFTVILLFPSPVRTTNYPRKDQSKGLAGFDGFILMLMLIRLGSLVFGEMISGFGFPASGVIKQFVSHSGWILNSEVLVIYLSFSPVLYFRWLAYFVFSATLLLSGMKSAIVLPIVVFGFSVFLISKLKVKHVFLISALGIGVLFFFPIVKDYIAYIREGGAHNVTVLRVAILQIFDSTYWAKVVNTLFYLSYRTSLIEPVEVLVSNSHHSNVRFPNSVFLFLDNFINAFLPKTLEINFSGFGDVKANRLYAIWYYGQDPMVRSSENLGLPGILLFFFPKVGILLFTIIGILFRSLINFANTIRDYRMNLFCCSLGALLLLKLTQSGSIEHMALWLKSLLSFVAIRYAFFFVTRRFVPS